MAGTSAGAAGVRTRVMIVVSLLLNLVVLIPVCLGILRDAPWAREAYGPPTPARAILVALYVAIAALSAGLLARPEPRMVAALLLVQVIYKLLTPLTVGALRHPVVASNLLIAAVHVVTLLVIWRRGRG